MNVKQWARIDFQRPAQDWENADWDEVCRRMPGVQDVMQMIRWSGGVLRRGRSWKCCYQLTMTGDYDVEESIELTRVAKDVVKAAGSQLNTDRLEWLKMMRELQARDQQAFCWQ